MRACVCHSSHSPLAPVPLAHIPCSSLPTRGGPRRNYIRISPFSQCQGGAEKSLLVLSAVTRPERRLRERVRFPTETLIHGRAGSFMLPAGIWSPTPPDPPSPAAREDINGLYGASRRRRCRFLLVLWVREGKERHEYVSSLSGKQE